jgi:uncharacterized cysteine cluster protein YcgN (CxxCxxCC family)
MSDQFWEKPLDELSGAEWEALCDGCARCCLIKIEDEDSGEVLTTSVSCNLLDLDQCRCSDYPARHVKQPECVHLTLERVREFDWLPDTCAYRLRYHNQPLPDWHYLICGDRERVHEVGASIRSFAVLEQGDEDLEDFVID